MTTLYGVILVIALYMTVDYGDSDALDEYIMVGLLGKDSRNCTI